MAWASHGERQGPNLTIFPLNKVLQFGAREMAQGSGALAAPVENLNSVLSIHVSYRTSTTLLWPLWTSTLTCAHTCIIGKYCILGRELKRHRSTWTLSKGPGLIPSIHMAAHSHLELQSSDSNVLFCLLYAPSIYKHTCRQNAHTHKNTLKNFQLGTCGGGTCLDSKHLGGRSRKIKTSQLSFLTQGTWGHPGSDLLGKNPTHIPSPTQWQRPC